MPLWAIRYAVASKNMGVNAVVWPTSISRGPSRKDLHEKYIQLKGKKLHLLEFDITLVSRKEDGKPTLKFARTVLARAAHSGYHGVVIVGLFHAGVRATSSLLAPTPSLKDAADFPSFLQHAHDRNLAVFLEVPSRAIAGKSYLPSHFFAEGQSLQQKFDFARKEVAQYLLYCLQQLGGVLISFNMFSGTCCLLFITEVTILLAIFSVRHWVETGVDGFRLESRLHLTQISVSARRFEQEDVHTFPFQNAYTHLYWYHSSGVSKPLYKIYSNVFILHPFHQNSSAVFAQEGLPGVAPPGDVAIGPSDDFTMMATALARSAAQGFTRDVMSIGIGELEDGLCVASSVGR